ncbi:MAG: DEAD/DEAH box helicase [Traorella sp.]
MKFNEFNLNPDILQALDELNYQQVLPVQKKVIPNLLEYKDILVQSKTGSGKTAAYAIPEIEKIDWLINTPQVLIITPTRELAKQVAHEFKTIGAYKRINSLAIIGQQPIKGQIIALKQKVHVVSGTIGRILDHIERNTIDLSQVHTCIIDEADECFNLGFQDDLISILKALPFCNKALFSATLNDNVKDLAREYLHDPVEIILKENKEYNTNIALHMMKVTKENRLEQLFNLINIQKPTQAIIFCNFKESVESVFDEFFERGYSCCMIHGGLSQDERLENMRDFKKGMFRFLIASDVVSRGIDIAQISHVYNYECPTTSENLIHRIGRSGRVDKKGDSITFVFDTQMKYVERIEEDLDTKFIEMSPVDNTSIDDSLKTSHIIELKDEKIHQKIMKLYIHAGKNKKIRRGDILGAILSNPMFEMKDIGVIEVLDYQSYVEVLNGKGEDVLNYLNQTTIKNRKFRIEKSKS